MLDQKEYFLKNQLFIQAYSASVQHNKVYSVDDLEKKKEMFDFLFDHHENTIKPKYISPVSHEAHLREIANLSDIVTNRYSAILYNGRYRIGTAQKLLNLYLKYLWCLGEVAEPPHMPVDRIILDQLWKIRDKSKDNSDLKTNWTKLDSIKTYENIIFLAQSLVNNSLSKWELEIWTEVTK